MKKNNVTSWHLIAIFLFLFLGISFSACAQDSTSFYPKDATYLWPTDASHHLTSTFGETRTGHFHAGLDIKTWGHRGYPIYATRSGELYRMAIQPDGYGRVLYLRHDDGSFSVYAHLLRFNHQFQQLADSIRFTDYDPFFDIVLDSLHIHVKKGEKIALSGASGDGAPHLHFELRTPKEHPFNPFLTNLKVKDTISPTFTGLAVVPLSIKSKIEHKNRIYTRRPRRKKNFADFGTIKISGPVGLAADVYDRANGVHNAFAAYKLSLSVDGQQVFQSKVNEFSYPETEQLQVDRIYSLLKSTGHAYQRLYIADGNTLPFYKTSGDDGRLRLAPGRHNIVIKAADFFGNTRMARLTLIKTRNKVETASVSQSMDSKKLSGSVNPRDWHWFNNWVNIPAREFKHIIIKPLHTSPTSLVRFRNRNNISVDLSRSPQIYFRTSPGNFFIAKRVYPHQSANLVTPDGQARASFSAGTFYDTTSVAIKKRELSPHSMQIKLFPATHPVKKSFLVSVKLDSVQQADSTLSFYKTSPDDEKYEYLKSQRKNHHLTAEFPSLGQYTILGDHKPPRLGPPRVAKTPDGRWLVYIPAQDKRSGLDFHKTKIFVNGVRGLPEYDPEHHRLVYYLPGFTPKKTNSVKVIAFDKEGNRSEKKAVIPR